MIVKDIGNHHFTYTEIELKDEDYSLQEKLGEISNKLADLNIVKQKLVSIESKLQEDQQGHPLALKHKKTKKHIEQEILNLTKKKQEIESHHTFQKDKLAIKILGDLYPQTKIKKVSTPSFLKSRMRILPFILINQNLLYYLLKIKK